MADTVITPAAASPVAKKLTATPKPAKKAATPKLAKAASKPAQPAAAPKKPVAPKVAKPKPAAAPKPTPAPRVKVAASIDLGQGLASPEESRRAPLGDTLDRAKALVAKFGGKGPVKVADAATALGVDAQEIKRRVKRLRSWFGATAVIRKGGEITINVKL